MRRVPILALVAALIIATTVTILIHVVSMTEFAPPIVSPSATFTVPVGSPVAYMYSASAVSVASNVTVDYRIASFVFAPYVALSAPLPQGVFLRIDYKDPISGDSYTFALYNASNGNVYYYRITYPSTCTWYIDPYLVDNKFFFAKAAVVRTGAGTLILYPNLADVGFVQIDNSTVSWVQYSDGKVIATCNWHKTYLGTTGYSLNIGNLQYSIIVKDTPISVVVRSYVIGAVWTSKDAKVTISAS